MKFTSKIGLHNEFDIEVKDIRTGEIKQRGKAYNILLNKIYNDLCSRQPFFNKIRFGRGAGALDPSRTTLFNDITFKDASSVEEVRDVNNNIFYRKLKIVLLPAEFVGETITEVGIAGNSGLNSHALIQDAEGNQIAIGPKTQYDEVTIYATVYFQLYDNGNIKWSNLSNNSNHLINYLFGSGMSTPAILLGQSRSASLDSAILAQLASKPASYTAADAANKKLKTTVITFETTEGNGDVFEVGLQNIFRALLPTPGIWDGYNVVNEAVGTGDGNTKVFSLKKNYPKSGKVYVNGVEVNQSEYTIIPGASIDATIHMSTYIQEVQANTLSGVMGTDKLDYMFTGIKTDKSGKSNETYITTWLQFHHNHTGKVKGIRFYNAGNQDLGSYTIKGSNDGVNWTTISSGSNSEGANFSLLFGLSCDYSWYRIERGSSYKVMTDAIIYLIGAGDQLVFTNPVPVGAVVTADYHVDQIPKDSNHTLGVSFEIQFGEGSAS